MLESSSVKINQLICVLTDRFGEIPWWPGNADEVMIGAILIQQTRWKNVERALVNLKKKGLCSLDTIFPAELQEIEDAVRCTGFYRIKARRLKSLAIHVMEIYRGAAGMADIPTGQLRQGLLNVPGIGEETADSILCYGLSRTSFVIDAYTERMVQCVGVMERHGALKSIFEEVLKNDNYTYRQTHAHIVEYGKEYCGKKRCSECILLSSNA
ncbi:MAG: Fe-S cluster assembly protein HesB [Methanoregula sp.]|jgi:endonuclease-3 related protein